MAEKYVFLNTLSAYVPRFVLRQILAAPESSPAGQEERMEAALLFADVSGFTAMSESLARLGKEGAEELTHALNAYFTRMIDIVNAYGGDILKFGGDAITCAFSERPMTARQLQWAVHCALAMQEAMADFRAVETKGGVFELRMKIGLSAGPVLSLILGDSQAGLEYVLAGRALDRMAEAEHHAAPGEVVVDASFAGLPGLLAREKREDFLVIESPASPARREETPEPPWNVPDEETAGRAIAQLIPFVPPTVYERILEGQREFVAEQRQVVSLFANFAGLDYDRDPQAGQKLQRYYTAMQEIVHRYGGRLNRVITGDKGNLLHIIFGAPVGHEDDAERAIGCAMEMQKRIGRSGELSFIAEQRIGIASGYVFAGAVGSERRREYTVMGDVVNLSARLMQAAGAGAIITDRRTAQRAERNFVCQTLPPIRVKGKQAPVPICQPIGPREEGRVWGRAGTWAMQRAWPIVGRERELARIAEIITQAAAGHGQLLIITGEAGVGKSRLLEELVALAHEKAPGVYGLGGDCLSYGSQSPYLPWIDFFTSYFGFGVEREESIEERIRHIEQRMAEADPPLAGWAPLMGQLLGLPMPDNDLTAALDAQLRKQRIFDITLTLVRQQALRSPLFLIVFEDVHWMDAISLELLHYVARNVAPYRILLVALHRPTLELTEWKRYSGCHQIELTDLPAEDALKLVQFKLGMSETPALLRERVLRGEERVNPFFVEELLNALIDRGYLAPRPAGAGYEIVGDLARAELPDSIQALVMSRIDRLDESSKLTVKVASVIGRVFKYGTLRSVYPVEVSEERLRENLERLSALDLTPLDRPAPEWEYIFKHIITQEVAYESLLFVHRRELHHRVAAYIERTHLAHLEEYYGLLAHHYSRSGDSAKSWAYLVKAGDQARDRYANEAAIAYYQQALALGDVDAPADEIASVQESLGDVYRHVGQYQQAMECYEAAYRHVLPSPRAAALLRRIAKTWELRGRYDKAMRYLGRARNTLKGMAASAELARIYSDMGWVAMRRGEYEKAIQWCRQGLRATGQLPDGVETQRVIARLQHALGTIYSQTGDYRQASSHLLTCIRMQEKSGDLYRLSQSYNSLAAVYWGQGDYSLATQYIQESLRTNQKIGHVYGTAMCYNNLGAISYTLGDYPRAIEYYEASLSLRQQIGDLPGIADVYTNLGEVYHALGQYPQALDYLQKAAHSFTEIGNRIALCDACKLLAGTEMELGDLTAAAAHAGQALELARETGNREYEGVALRVSGQVNRAAGRAEEARRDLDASLQILTETANRLELGKSYYELGITLAGQAEGREALQRAVEIFREMGIEKELEKAQRMMT